MFSVGIGMFSGYYSGSGNLGCVIQAHSGAARVFEKLPLTVGESARNLAALPPTQARAS
jgi:hypothetical protein